MSNGDFFQILFSNTWGIILVITFFCGSIFVHELGHFLAAKWRGLKIERFSIGFGPKLFGWTKNGIDYRVSLLPLGGYVALPQLADLRAIEGETDEEFDDLPPISYADKMIVSVMGAVFNIIFAFVLALIIWTVGRPSADGEQSNVIGYVVEELTLDDENKAPSPAKLAGLQPGDKVLAIDGKKTKSFSDITKYVVTGAGRDNEDNPQAVFTIERDGNVFDLEIFPLLTETNAKSGERVRKVGIWHINTIRIGKIEPSSPAAQAGLQKGDVIQAIDGQTIYSFRLMLDYMKKKVGKTTQLTIDRAGETVQIAYTPIELPATKPLLKLNYGQEDTKSLQYSLSVLPHYQDESKTDLDSPAKTAVLKIFEKPKDMSFITNGQMRIGDTVLLVNGQNVNSLQQMHDVLNQSAKDSVTLTLQRNTSTFDAVLKNPKSTTIQDSMPEIALGFIREGITTIVYPNPIEQFVDKIKMTFTILGSLLNKDSNISVNHLMGPVGIARILHTFSLQDIRLVLWFTVLLNINLAVLNLLPIPVLDGGHMVFATMSKLRGKPLPANFIAGTQGAFMVILLGLMMYILFYDSLRWMGDHDREQRFLQRQAYFLDFVYPGADSVNTSTVETVKPVKDQE